MNGNGDGVPENRSVSGDGRWQPGQSGNPGGRPRALRDVIQAAREYTHAALARLVALMGSDNESVALRAAEALLERAWGRPQDVDLAARLEELEERLGIGAAEARR